MNLFLGTILQVNRPLYGVPEAGNHWFLIYQIHHIKKLDLTTLTYDPCLLYSQNATVGLQTDDSLIVATPEFIKIEDYEIKQTRFLCKPIKKLDLGNAIEFNGFRITSTENGIQITQKKQRSQISLLNSDFIHADYIRQRVLEAYLAPVSQSEVLFMLFYAAQIQNPTWNDAQFLNRCL